MNSTSDWQLIHIGNIEKAKKACNIYIMWIYWMIHGFIIKH